MCRTSSAQSSPANAVNTAVFQPVFQPLVFRPLPWSGTPSRSLRDPADPYRFAQPAGSRVVCPGTAQGGSAAARTCVSFSTQCNMYSKCLCFPSAEGFQRTNVCISRERRTLASCLDRWQAPSVCISRARKASRGRMCVFLEKYASQRAARRAWRPLLGLAFCACSEQKSLKSLRNLCLGRPVANPAQRMH